MHKYTEGDPVYALWDIIDPREGLIARGLQLGSVKAVLPDQMYAVTWQEGTISNVYEHEIAEQKLNR